MKVYSLVRTFIDHLHHILDKNIVESTERILGTLTYYPFDMAFYSKHFVMIDHILSELFEPAYDKTY